ncbi:MAG: GNAT family N-acetyltransferase [Pseudomonadota bacterium]
MTLSLRPVANHDTHACLSIYLDAIHNGTSPHYTEAEREAWAPRDAAHDLDAWESRLKTGLSFLAEDEAEPVGFITMTGDGYLDLFFVRPIARRNGAAAALYDHLLTAAREKGLTQLTTHASHLARWFLERRGWTVLAPEMVERHGVSLERFEMCLTLNAD